MAQRYCRLPQRILNQILQDADNECFILACGSDNLLKHQFEADQIVRYCTKSRKFGGNITISVRDLHFQTEVLSHGKYGRKDAPLSICFVEQLSPEQLTTLTGCSGTDFDKLKYALLLRSASKIYSDLLSWVIKDLNPSPWKDLPQV